MFKVAVLTVLVGFAACGRLENLYLPPTSGGRPQGSVGGPGSGPQIPILRLDNQNNGDGSYQWAYETGNGIQAQEQGQPKAQGPEGPAVVADGSFSWKSPEGQTFTVTYTADENGFHPQGAHLPTPPPIPEAILKSLEVIRAAEASGGSSSLSSQYGVPAATLPLQQVSAPAGGYRY